jgi:hypothetical protein
MSDGDDRRDTGLLKLAEVVRAEAVAGGMVVHQGQIRPGRGEQAVEVGGDVHVALATIDDPDDATVGRPHDEPLTRMGPAGAFRHTQGRQPPRRVSPFDRKGLADSLYYVGLS